jgi:hypothetical protein
LVPAKYQMFDTVLTGNVNEGNGTVLISFNSKIAEVKRECSNYNQAFLIAYYRLVSLTGILMSK